MIALFLIVPYTYDGLGRLTRENNERLNQTTIFTYDAYGNVTKRAKCAYTTEATPGVNTENFEYTDGAFPDRLTKANGQSIAYDKLGNPTTYKGAQLSWERGGLLSSYTNSNGKTTYKYNSAGQRIRKTEYDKNSKIKKQTGYYLEGSRVMAKLIEEMGTFLVKNKIVEYFYNGEEITHCRTNNFTTVPNDARPIVIVENHYYRFERDSLGNISKVIWNSSTGGAERTIALINYDAWGVPSMDLSGMTELSSSIRLTEEQLIDVMPFIWKGFQYEYESGLYYANGNYYDPKTGRQINAQPIDTVLSRIGEADGLNLYVFSCNDPINMVGNLSMHAYPSLELVAEKPANPTEWQVFWYKAFKWYSGIHWSLKILVGYIVMIRLATVVALTGGAAAGSTMAAAHCLFSSMLIGAAYGAMIGAAVGAAIGGAIGYGNGIEGLIGFFRNRFIMVLKYNKKG